MLTVDLRLLLGRLTPYAKRMLETAAGLAVSRTHYEVTVEHVLQAMIEDSDADFQAILRHHEIAHERIAVILQKAIEGLKSGNSGRPVFSPLLVEWISDAWLIASVELRQGTLRTGAMVTAAVVSPHRYGSLALSEILEQIPGEALRRQLLDIVAGTREQAATLQAAPTASDQAGDTAPSDDSALGRFTQDLTERARAGKIDPVFCRDKEIALMTDILTRRRKNNPICVGEPGTGKTAVVEGLAVRMAAGDVPDMLKNVSLRGLDLGLLQAGASVKGEFENRLNGVIQEVKASVTPVILFIDEAHTLIGAGGAAGGGDAANLLKPALARGELRTIAATTWSEYKKYFEKDPALARRFQLVKLDEPSVDDAIVIMRGLRTRYEKSHQVYLRDDAVVAAAKLSARYITGRLLPDKAVDLIDTACARVKLSQSTKPFALHQVQQDIALLERERTALVRDLAVSDQTRNDRTDEIDRELAEAEKGRQDLQTRWDQEMALVSRADDLRTQLGIGIETAANGEPAADAPVDDAVDAPETETTPAAEPAPVVDRAALFKDLKATQEELQGLQGRNPLVNVEVTPDVVGQVVSDWTGIPVGSMVRAEADSVLRLAEDLKKRIIGQDHAIGAIDQGLRASKAGLGNPRTPIGVFLFVGPSGVGKTELATAVADELFGGERFLISINMSEFQEKHTVSRLVGSPPGYVGYGEGGVLTEAVRQRPYSVVLLDEVEKADLEVMNLFYQVFDKGTLSDGEGRVIDFRNTLVCLTSNLATDVLMEMGTREKRPPVEEMTAAIRPILSRHFKPALLARMHIVPFYPLLGEPLGKIVQIKMNQVAKRLKQSHHAALVYSDAVVEEIANRCTEVETGARNIDHIINKRLLPMIGTEILERMSQEAPFDTVSLSLTDDKTFACDFEAD